MNNRKRNYILLSVCIAAEFLLVRILKDSGVPSPTGLINAICTLLFFSPIVILLLYLSNDKRIKNTGELFCDCWLYILAYRISRE